MYGDIIVGLFTVLGTLAGIILKDRLENRKRLDLNKDFELKAKILPILEEIRYELDADSVQYWVFSNGDVTSSGHHLKKMSIIQEANKQEYSIAHLFQLVPTKNFDRALNKLHDSDEGYFISYEKDNKDDESYIYKMYDAETIFNVKLMQPGGKWMGIISIWFNNDRHITDKELAFTKLQTSRIGAIK